MNLRYGTTNDAALLSEFGANTFYDTFAKDNTKKKTIYICRNHSPRKSNSMNFPHPMKSKFEWIQIGHVQFVVGSWSEPIPGS